MELLQKELFINLLYGGPVRVPVDHIQDQLRHLLLQKPFRTGYILQLCL